MKGKNMGILYETARVTQHNTREDEFSFNRSLEIRDTKTSNEFQGQKAQMSDEWIPEPPVHIRDYKSIGSDVKEALEKADQLEAEKVPPVPAYMQPALTDPNERAVQQLTVHRTEAYGYFDELGKKLGKIAKTTETRKDDRYAEALSGKLGAELANVNSVSVRDVENTFYELSK